MSENDKHLKGIHIEQNIPENNGQVTGIKIENINVDLAGLVELLRPFQTLSQHIPTDKKEQEAFLHKGLKVYAEKFVTRYNRMQIFGQPKPKRLTDVYIDLNVVSTPSRLENIDANSLNENFGRDLHTYSNIKRKKPGLSLVNKEDRLIILGKPGAGKSTFLKHVAISSLSGNLERTLLPVFVGLRRWHHSELSIIDYIVQEFEICDFPEAFFFISDLLRNGQLLVLFDGYDELPHTDKKAADQIQDFIDQHEKNKYILSCRNAAYRQTIQGFTQVEITNFFPRSNKKICCQLVYLRYTKS